MCLRFAITRKHPQNDQKFHLTGFPRSGKPPGGGKTPTFHTPGRPQKGDIFLASSPPTGPPGTITAWRHCFQLHELCYQPSRSPNLGSTNWSCWSHHCLAAQHDRLRGSLLTCSPCNVDPKHLFLQCSPWFHIPPPLNCGMTLVFDASLTA